MGPYRAVLLDAGFTVIDHRSSQEEVLMQVARSRGQGISPEDLRRAREAAQSFFDRHYYRPNETWAQDASIHAFWTAYYRTALEALEWPAGPAQATAARLAAEMEHPHSWRAFPESAAVLAGLKAGGYRVGILSDWSSSLPAILQAVGLAPYPDFLVVSAIEGVAKPQRRFFALALERAGVQPHEALMVGDNLYADIQGAMQAGIRGLLLDRKDRHDGAEVPTIRNLDEVWPYLA